MTTISPNSGINAEASFSYESIGMDIAAVTIATFCALPIIKNIAQGGQAYNSMGGRVAQAAIIGVEAIALSYLFERAPQYISYMTDEPYSRSDFILAGLGAVKNLAQFGLKFAARTLYYIGGGN